MKTLKILKIAIYIIFFCNFVISAAAIIYPIYCFFTIDDKSKFILILYALSELLGIYLLVYYIKKLKKIKNDYKHIKIY